MVSSTARSHFTPGKDPVPILQEAGWAGSVWTVGKSRHHRDSIPDRPARSQSLYRLSYSAHNTNTNNTNNINNMWLKVVSVRTQWPRGLRRRSAVARWLRLWVRILLGHGCLSVVSFVCCQVEVSATG